METPTTETPAAVSAPVELSLDEIVAAELKAADATGTPVVETPKAATETPPTGDKPAEEAPPGVAPAETPATEETTEEPKVDDVTARRVRTMLAEVDKRKADLDERERTLGKTLIDELFKAPRATLAKFGRPDGVNDLIDASIAEGKGEPAPVAAPARDPLDERLTRLETLEQQKAIDNRKAEIRRDITAASAKYPALTSAGRVDDVLDYMVEYHSIHGQPISWDKAAAAVERDLTGVGIAVAKKLGWSAPAPKPAAAPAPKDRPGTVSIGGDQRTAAPPTAEAEPEDPEKLLQYLVAQAGLK